MPTSKPEAPNPEGPQPDGWEARHWIAYSAWASGKTRREAAAESGYSKGHIGSLVARWRETYDVSGLDFRSPGISPEARALGQISNATAWMGRRAEVAARMGETVTGARDLLDALLRHYSTRVHELQPRDIAVIARALRDLVATADQLAGIPDSTRAYVFQQNTLNVGGGTDGGVEENLLDGLLDAGSTPHDILEAVDVLARGYLAEVVEVDEIEGDGAA